MKFFVSAAVLSISVVAFGQTPKMQGFDDLPVQTKHSITIKGTKIDYTATAGYLPIKNDSGETEGRIFFVAYTKDGEAAGTRPVTFAYNGGPGSASLWLHLGTIGPRRVPMNDDGSLPKPPYQVVDNQETWLPATDIVMVDAMGTGYSRLAKPEFGKQFYGVRADIRAFGEFIRSYLSKNGRFKSPVFLAGESYGGIRTAGLSSYLLGNGIALNGAIIVSGTMNFQTLDGGRGNDLPFLSFLPTFSAVAWYHKKLEPKYLNADVRVVTAEAEKFAEGDYAAALLKGSSLSAADEAKIAKRMSELTGLKEAYILGSHLRVPEFRFFKELLRDEGKTTGRYDGRLTGTDALPVGDGPEYDASSAATTPVFYSCINDYLSNELGYSTDLRYRIFKTDGGWDNDVEEGYPDTSEDLRQALNQNPYLKVLFAVGWYDLACPYFGTHFTVNHMDLGPKQLANLSWQFYPAGHMMYIERSSREKLAKDVTSFINGAK
jgi:carboxypeptidase C (cathepsin A)